VRPSGHTVVVVVVVLLVYTFLLMRPLPLAGQLMQLAQLSLRQ